VTFEAKAPCHSLPVFRGEQRGTAATRPGSDQDSSTTPPQISAATTGKKLNLPKLMSIVGLPLRPGCGAGAPVPAERQADQVRQSSK